MAEKLKFGLQRGDILNREYFVSSDKWVSDITKAHRFPTLVTAVDYKTKHYGLGNSVIVSTHRVP